MKLDLGCGLNKKPGFVGVDIIPHPGVDIVLNLEQFPWSQLKENSVDEIHCGHYAEHTPDLIQFMDEIWRISKPGALIVIQSPYYTSVRAWQDPTHKRVISQETFHYFDKTWRDKHGMSEYPAKGNFKLEKTFIYFDDPWKTMPEAEQMYALRHYWNVAADIKVELRVVK